MFQLLKRRRWLLLLLFAATLPNGCTFQGATGIPPIPVPAWVPDQIEERAKYRNDFKMPIMPPIPPGHTPNCEDPPDTATILRAMPRVARGVPGLYEEFRDQISTTTEKLVDHLDPPRFFPMIGPAQLHHCHWQCTVYYTETIMSSYPLPFQITRRRRENIYIDQDHLHRFIAGQDSMPTVVREEFVRP